MDTTGFIKYADILNLLECNYYNGFIATRMSKNRIRRTFISYKWHMTDIAVETLKLNGENIVIKIEINGEEINDMEELKVKITHSTRCKK